MKNKRWLAGLLAVILLISCVGVGASADNSTGYESIRVNCTMYGDAKTQRGFTWFTEKICDSTIQIVPLSQYAVSRFSDARTVEGTVSNWEGYYCHKVVVDKLKPGVEYRYRVGSIDRNTWSSVGKLVTDDGNNSFSFLAIADVQASNLENFTKAARVMDKAMKTDKNAEFVVNLGDFVNMCTNDEWNWYGEAFQKANTNLTMVPVAGNHEGNITNKLNVGWFDNMFNLLPGDSAGNRINGTYYSFDYGNTHFTVLNTNDMYPMTAAQRNWVMNDITNSNAYWKILLLHRGPYSAGKNINKPDTIAMRKTIIEIVDQTNVDMVLSGHDHMYYRTKQVKNDTVVDNVRFVTEKHKGVDTTFAINPDGAIYALPGTAGTKRYSLNENPVNPIKSCADKMFDIKTLGGCFANVKVDGNKLVYTAYAVNDETQKVTKIDEYAIKKTVADKPVEGTKLPTDGTGTLDKSVLNFVFEIVEMLVTYVTKLLPQTIKGLF